MLFTQAGGVLAGDDGAGALYGYATGVYSSRKMEAKTYDDLAFRYLSPDAHPDHDTLAEFRKRHLEALAGLFMQALLLCEKADLVKLGHVSIGGGREGPGDRGHGGYATSQR